MMPCTSLDPATPPYGRHNWKIYFIRPYSRDGNGLPTLQILTRRILQAIGTVTLYFDNILKRRNTASPPLILPQLPATTCD